MPRALSSNIAHTAITDHRILRKPAPARPPRPLRPGEVPIVNFFAEAQGPHAAGTERDLGLALVYLAPNAPGVREVLTPLGLPLLEKAVREAPDDAEAWEARGWSLALLSRWDEARAALETALRLAPQRELALSVAAQVAERLGRDEDALAYIRRGAAANPWNWEFRRKLAALLAQRQQWGAARDEAEAALRLNPVHQQTRLVLITCCLRTGDRQRAQREFETLLALDPDDAARWRQWFAEQRP
jgi:tetratricopeptide (TPR) repeat protein